MMACVPAATVIGIVVTSVQPVNVPTTFSLYFVFTWVTREPVAPPLLGPAIAALIPMATTAPIVTSTTARRYRIAPPSVLGRGRPYPERKAEPVSLGEGNGAGPPAVTAPPLASDARGACGARVARVVVRRVVRGAGPGRVRSRVAAAVGR